MSGQMSDQMCPDPVFWYRDFQQEEVDEFIRDADGNVIVTITTMDEAATARPDFTGAYTVQFTAHLPRSTVYRRQLTPVLAMARVFYTEESDKQSIKDAVGAVILVLQIGVSTRLGISFSRGLR